MTSVPRAVVPYDPFSSVLESVDLPFINALDYGATGDGTTDDTVALQAFFTASAGRLGFLPEGSYKVTDSVLINANLTHVIGEGTATKIINMAPAGKPTIKILDAFHFNLGDFEISGRTGYPNTGIQVTGSGGSDRSGYGTLSNLMLCPNGVGVNLQECNTIALRDLTYWPPTGYNGGATIDSNALTHAILADGTGAVNDITIYDLAASNNTTIAAVASSAAIKWNTTDSSQGIRIFGGSCENSGTRAVDLNNVYQFVIEGLFMENADVRVLNSRWGRITVQGGGTGSVTVGNSNVLYTCVGIVVRDSVLGTVTIDGYAQLSGTDSVHAQTTLSNASPSPIQINTRGPASADMPNMFGQPILTPANTVTATPYSIPTTDRYSSYFINVGSAASVVLPSAVSAGNGFRVTVKDKSGAAGVNNITITSSAGTIDGVGSKVISSNYGFYRFESDGNNWFTS